MKKILTVCMMLIGASSIFADYDYQKSEQQKIEKETSNVSFVYPYIGVKGGLSLIESHKDFRTTAFGNLGAEGGSDGGLVGAFTGLGMRFWDGYLGLDYDFNWLFSNKFTLGPLSSYSFTSKDDMLTSLRGRLGYYVGVDKALLYLQGGYAWNKTDKKHYSGGSLLYHHKKWLSGPAAGFGMTLYLVKHFGINLDYVFVWDCKAHFKEEAASLYYDTKERLSIATIGLLCQF